MLRMRVPAASAICTNIDYRNDFVTCGSFALIQRCQALLSRFRTYRYVLDDQPADQSGGPVMVVNFVKLPELPRKRLADSD